MALKNKPRGVTWSRIHFVLRLAGLSGLLAGGVGLALALITGFLTWDTIRASLTSESLNQTIRGRNLPSWDSVIATLRGERGTTDLWIGWLLLAGSVTVLLALLVELTAVSRVAAGRRSAFGFNVALQVVLATILLLGINLFSFDHYLRFDCSRDHKFTLPVEIADALSRLRSKTNIVVYQRHKTFGQLTDKPDAFDYAAERKVVEKVKDLVDQFRELGPQFRVVVLDVEEEGFDKKLAEETRNNSALRDAINTASENSIFFASNDKVQRLSFNDFYQLDKTRSKEEGNLVLLYQGVEPFARKVLNLDEKKPRVALGVVHEVLSEEGSEELGMAGVKKTLTAHGFESRDIILKKWSEMAPPEPGVFTFDENKFERLEEQLTELDSSIKNLEEEMKEFTALLNLWKSGSLEELTKKYADQLDKNQKITEPIRRRQLAILQQNVGIRGLLLDQQREERKTVAREKSGLNVESLEEQRRIGDLKAKTERMLADCDLLILPRMTLFNVSRGERIGNWVYRLDESQVAAVKDFLKSGKPVLFCFGPSNEPAGRPDPLGGGPDRLEEMVEQLGIKLGKQTILFNVESKSFAERRSGLLVLGANVEVPPVDFQWEAGAGQKLASDVVKTKPNPIQQSMKVTASSIGKDQALDLRLRHPRPVYFEPRHGEKPAFDPVFMMSNPASWNEEQPFPTRERTPRFEPPKGDDPTRGTLDEKRRGPFPVGIAVETTVPVEWSDEKGSKPGPVRVAAIGHGGLFIGNTLSPAKDKLLLDVCNWLLGRDDLLAREDRTWSYPRIAMTDIKHAKWHWGTRLGLPALFAYLGLMVVLARRVR